MQCIELVPGANHLVVPPEKDPEPPESFIDRNTYSYRLVAGKKVLKGVALGPGWQNQRFNPSCEKGEEITVKREPDWDAILENTLKLSEEKGLSLYKASQMIAKEALRKQQEQQAQPAAPEPAAKPETGDADKAEPAGTSITQIKDASEQKPAWDTLWPLAQELKSRGLTWAQVADELGVSYYSLKHKIDRERKKANQHNQAFDLDRFKIRVLEIFQEVAAHNQAPAHVSLAFVDAIINADPDIWREREE